MEAEPTDTIKIFICYAREDEEYRKSLEKQLRVLKRQHFIDVWHDREIAPGMEWQQEIDSHLNAANVILLLVSPDFMDSDYCYSIEMVKAMERHERGEAHVIPIIIRPIYWEKAPFGKLQALPTDGVPVTSHTWYSLDNAFFNVAEGIRKVIETIQEERLRRAEEERLRKAEEERLAEIERRRKEQLRLAEEERQRQLKEEQQRLAEEERLRKLREEQQRQAEEEQIGSPLNYFPSQIMTENSEAESKNYADEMNKMESKLHAMDDIMGPAGTALLFFEIIFTIIILIVKWITGIGWSFIIICIISIIITLSILFYIGIRVSALKAQRDKLTRLTISEKD